MVGGENLDCDENLDCWDSNDVMKNSTVKIPKKIVMYMNIKI